MTDEPRRKRLPRVAGACGVAVLAASCALLGVGAAGANTARTSRPAAASSVIYVIGYQQNNPFWDTEGKGAQQAGSQYGVTVRYEAPATSSDAGMVALIDAAIATHPYGIAIDYTDKTMQAPVLRALGAGIKVVLYNNNRFEAQSGGATTNPAVTNLAFVGQNEHLSGDVLGTAFINFLPKSGGTVLIINPFPAAYVLTLRADGVSSTALHAAGYKTTVLDVNGNDSESTIEPIIGAYLSAHKVVGVVGLGDPGASPATLYIDQHNLKIPVCAFDIDTVTYSLMKGHSHEVLALDQQPFLQAYFAAENLILEMKYGFQPVSVNTGTFLVTQKNISLVGQLVGQGRD